jgi:hypothetical protein
MGCETHDETRTGLKSQGQAVSRSHAFQPTACGLAGGLPRRGHAQGGLLLRAAVQRAAAPSDRRLRDQSARRFGKFGVCKVRCGKSRRASPPKPRSVLTVFDWAAGVLEDWLANGRGTLHTPDLFPSERGGLIVESTPTAASAVSRGAGDADGLDLHSLRRSYATHLLEAGWDPRFVQYQMGHEYASTTGIYQFVSDDFRNTTLRASLDRTMDQALGKQSGGRR